MGIVEPFKHLLRVTAHPQFLALELQAPMGACSGQYGTCFDKNMVRCSLVPTPCASRRETVWWTKLNFLGLFPKTVEDHWDCEIANYYVALPYNIQIYSSPFEYPCFFDRVFQSIRAFFERVFRKIFRTLLGYTVTKAPANPRNSTWFTRPFLLVRGWGLGTRLGQVRHNIFLW